MYVRLNGGLGNQLFQYAFGRSVAKARNEPLWFYKVALGKGCHRAYGLGAFQIPAEVQFCDQPKVVSTFVEKDLVFDPRVYTAPLNTDFIGCWQTEKFFDRELVRKELWFKDGNHDGLWDIADKIQEAAESSVFLHVRRTDYLTPGAANFHGNMTWNYYDAAMQHINERVQHPHFFIFSDDPDGCRARFGNYPQYTIVDRNPMGFGTEGPGKEHEDLWLMSLCNHAIIPNSTFGWWGAWLGEGDSLFEPASMYKRIVIAPKKWFGTATARYDDVVPERWIKMGEPAIVPQTNL